MRSIWDFEQGEHYEFVKLNNPDIKLYSISSAFDKLHWELGIPTSKIQKEIYRINSRQHGSEKHALRLIEGMIWLSNKFDCSLMDIIEQIKLESNNAMYAGVPDGYIEDKLTVIESGDCFIKKKFIETVRKNYEHHGIKPSEHNLYHFPYNEKPVTIEFDDEKFIDYIDVTPIRNTNNNL